MRTVIFVTDAKLADGQIARKGTVHSLNDASAGHHVKRGHAEYHVEIRNFAEPAQDPVEAQPDGDTMASSEGFVEGQDGSGSGERTESEAVPPFGSGTPRRRGNRRSQ